VTTVLTTPPSRGGDLPAQASIAFVPTMGALHQGHAELIRTARSHADRVVVSVFVNPTQFGPGEDFERYPRDLEADVTVAAAAGADVVFAPAAATVYPEGFATTVDPGPLGNELCGRSRPGHFAGVATVVVRLLGLIRPDVAVFGRKDFQQLTIVEQVARDLALATRIVGAPTVRDADGLATSSRNRYLTSEERERARALPRGLRDAAAAYAERPIADASVVASAAGRLDDLDVEYLELRRATDLGPAQPEERCVLLAAARVGSTRLIDNVVLDPTDPVSAIRSFPEES
jgi:pantoate--beta-alanine ligase